MDFTHFTISTIQRSRQQSSVGRAAYQSGHRLIDERTGQAHDYRYRRNRGDILFSALVHPDGRNWTDPPAWQLANLWNQVEQAERRRDAQVGRSGIVALPHLLSREGQQRVMLRFGILLARRYTTAVQVDLHGPGQHPAADARNFHGHWQMPTRSLDENGSFEHGRKFRQLSNRTLAREEVKVLRNLWVDTVNDVLEREGVVKEDGSPLRLDARSFRERGIDRVPELHLGTTATALERQGIVTDLGDRNRVIRADNWVLARLDQELDGLREERDLLLRTSAPGVADGGAGEDRSPGEGTGEREPTADPVSERSRDEDAVLAGLAAQVIRYRELVEATRRERALDDRIRAAEHEGRVAWDHAFLEALRAFATAMGKVFVHGSQAQGAWQEYRKRRGAATAVQALRQTPELFGSLRTEEFRRYWTKRSDDRAARAAAPLAADAGHRLIQEDERLERARAEAMGRARELLGELKALRAGTEPLVNRVPLEYAITRQWLAQPASVRAVLADSFPDVARVVHAAEQRLGHSL